MADTPELPIVPEYPQLTMCRVVGDLSFYRLVGTVEQRGSAFVSPEVVLKVAFGWAVFFAIAALGWTRSSASARRRWPSSESTFSRPSRTMPFTHTGTSSTARRPGVRDDAPVSEHHKAVSGRAGCVVGAMRIVCVRYALGRDMKQHYIRYERLLSDG